jgi:hypothetical protein
MKDVARSGLGYDNMNHPSMSEWIASRATTSINGPPSLDTHRKELKLCPGLMLKTFREVVSAQLDIPIGLLDGIYQWATHR